MDKALDIVKRERYQILSENLRGRELTRHTSRHSTARSEKRGRREEESGCGVVTMMMMMMREDEEGGVASRTMVTTEASFAAPTFIHIHYLWR